MIEDVWDTRDPVAATFASRWSELAATAPEFNFTMDLRQLEWEAGRGRHARAAISSEGGVRTAIVLRRESGGWVCGYPWRWQVADAAPPERASVVPPPDRCARWFEAASGLAGSGRLRMFLPGEAQHAPAYPAGRTLLVRLDRTDEQLLAGMDANKRRAIKKAAKEGWVVAPAHHSADFRRFHELRRETSRRREPGAADGAMPETAEPGAGEAWREWEHPWMKLFLASQGDDVGSGSGFGFVEGGMIDYRTNASRPDARKAGANAVLAFEALRFGRERGCRIMNWGGVTEFKREMGGEIVSIWCWLGGGAMWAVPNALEAGARAVIRTASRRLKRSGLARKA